MSIGTGIFLSALFLGFIFLYISTKDRWSWKKIFLKIFKVIVIFCILCVGGGYVAYRVVNNPRPIKTFQGISLDDPKCEIKFKKGKPAEDANDVWVYYDEFDKNGWIRVSFVGFGNSIFSISGSGIYIESLNGLGHYSSLDDIVKKLGNPSSISYGADGLYRLYCFDKYNQYFCLGKNRVLYNGIYNPVYGEVSLINAKKPDSIKIFDREKFKQLIETKDVNEL